MAMKMGPVQMCSKVKEYCQAMLQLNRRAWRMATLAEAVGETLENNQTEGAEIVAYNSKDCVDQLNSINSTGKRKPPDRDLKIGLMEGVHIC